MCPGTISSTGKKLNDVARWFVGDLATVSTNLENDEAHFGAPQTYQAPPTHLWVLPSLWRAVEAITSASSQWVFDKDGVEIALDYARADIAWRYAELALTKTDFNHVQTLERMILGLIRRPDEQQFEFGVTLSV